MTHPLDPDTFLRHQREDRSRRLTDDRRRGELRSTLNRRRSSAQF
jgi:hypothetical protein